MSIEAAAAPGERHAQLVALASGLRPELHRYCARFMGSVIDGEDVVQDTLMRALAALPRLDVETPLRPWLFRIAHNRALDLLRSRALQRGEPLDEVAPLADPASPDPMETLMRQQTVTTAVSRFGALPAMQRSVVILKDVLDESLAEIATLLGLTIDAVKAHLARGRARLREVNADADEAATAAGAATVPAPSAEVAGYVALFNRRDWNALRALLADDVRLSQSAHPPRAGREQVGMFFGFYANYDAVQLVPAWLEGREVIAVFEGQSAPAPSYFMSLEWRGGRITHIRDYRHVRYVADGAELLLAPA